MSGVIQRDFGGIVPTLYHWDEHTEELHVQRTQDVEPLLEKIKRLRSHGFDGYTEDRSARAISEIPVTILEQWQKEGLDFMDPNHHAEILKRLKSPDLLGFRLDLEGGMRRGIIVKGDR